MTEPQLDGGLLYSCIEQLEVTQLELLRLLRDQHIEIDPVQNDRFNLRLREVKEAAASLAARVQLLMLKVGVDRRVMPDRRQRAGAPRP